MAASQEDIGKWFDQGVTQGATHMLVVCDTYDWEDYPVYVKPGDDAHKTFIAYHLKDMQKVMEVYNLKMDKRTQLNQSRVMNF